jgi:galactose mutarotase-like enzyme
MPNSSRDLLIRSDRLEVAVSAEFGGGITGIRHLATGADVLWRTPWAEDTPSPPADGPLDVGPWVRHSRGGWQVLLPNGGDDCDWRGVRHGFHGEASVIPWAVSPPASSVRDEGSGATSVRLTAALTAAPLDVERTITVNGGDVVVRERVTNRTPDPVEVIWTHHPGFGGDLLAGGVTIDSNARTITLDDRAAVTGIGAAPGDRGRWPLVGPGAADLRHPAEGNALLGYLSEFDGAPWVSVIRDDESLGVRLAWDEATFPYCWMWQELGGTTGPPWHGEVRVIGIEPSTSWPGQGLATVASTTGTTRGLAGQESISSSVTLSVFAAADPNSANGESP